MHSPSASVFTATGCFIMFPLVCIFVPEGSIEEKFHKYLEREARDASGHKVNTT